MNKILISSLLLLITVCIPFLMTDSDEKSGLEYRYSERYDRFILENISINSFEQEKLLLTLKADKVLHRDRTVSIFRYHNLKEIYLSGLLLELYPDEANLSDGTIPAMITDGLIKNIGNVLLDDRSVTHEWTESFFSAGSIAVAPDYQLITRVVIDKPSIILHLNKGSLMKVSSDNAVVNIGSRNIVFRGNFSVADVNNETIYAPEAICNYRSDIIYFPHGYTMSDVTHAGEEAFSINAFGKLEKTVKPESDIFKKDRIEEMEEMLLAKYITPYFNALYMSLLTGKKVDPSIFKIQRQAGRFTDL